MSTPSKPARFEVRTYRANTAYRMGVAEWFKVVEVDTQAAPSKSGFLPVLRIVRTSISDFNSANDFAAELNNEGK